MSVWDNIYLTDAWGGGSGPGSKEETTREYRAFVERFIRLNQFKTVLDYGCGDGVLASLIDWKALGVTRLFGTDASAVARRLAAQNCADMTILTPTQAESLPADLVLVKDVFQHLSEDSIREALNILEPSLLLITNDIPRPEDEHDIKDGEWRPIDIRSLGYTSCAVAEFDSVPIRKRILLMQGK